MSENVTTQNSPKISWEGLLLPCNQLFFLPCSVHAIGPWVPAQRKNLPLFRRKPPCTQEVLLKDFMVHCMGQSYQWNTAQTEEASLGKYNLFHRLDFERSEHLRTGDSSRTWIRNYGGCIPCSLRVRIYAKAVPLSEINQLCITTLLQRVLHLECKDVWKRVGEREKISPDHCFRQ